MQLQKNPILSRRFLGVCVVATACFFGTPGLSPAADFADKARKPVEDALSIRQNTQKSEDQWAGEKEKLTAEYESLEKQIEKLALANRGIKHDLAQHAQTVASLEQKLAEMETISQEIEPYIYRIYDRIHKHVSEAPPFLTDERDKRLLKLGEILEDSQIKISEKFRRLTETLMIEAEYGSTIEVYPETVLFEGKEIQMQVFRLGRLALFCQSLDKQTAGFYDVVTRKWEKLPDKYNDEIDMAMEIGAKRRPVELVNLPLGRISKQ